MSFNPFAEGGKGGSSVYENLEAGVNITIEKTSDGKAKISASGEVSSEDAVARAAIAEMKDGENLNSFSDVEIALATKANASTTYTKNEVDTALNTKADIADVYSKTTIDTALGNKADKSTIYTKTEIDTALNAKANTVDVYSKSDVDIALNDKADKSTTYTKTEIDTALDIKQDVISDLSTIRNGSALGTTAIQPETMEAALAQKQDTLSAAQLAAINSGITEERLETVEITLNNKADIDDVYSKSDVDTALSDKADKATTYTKTEVDTELIKKANASTTYTKTEVDTALNAKANIADVYSKTDIDTTLDNKVDKEIGKGLSSNDYTTAEKTKLGSLAEIKIIGTGLNLDENGELTATGGGSGGTTNYNDLSNKPQINGNTLSGNKTSAQLGLANVSDIPTTLAELTDDATHRVVTDEEKAAWGAKSDFSGSYNDLIDKPTIPDELSDLTEDATHRTVTDTEKATWNAKADAADIPTVPVKGVAKNNAPITPDASGVVNITVPTTAAEVSALPATTLYGASISLSINTSTFVVTATLKDQNGDTLGRAQTIDLPLESVVVNGSYNSTTKNIELTLQSGSTVEFSVADLVAGLQSEITSTNKLDADLVDDSISTNKFVSSAEKSAWNSKSNLELGTTSTTAYRGDRGQIAYAHATDSNRLTTAKPSGLYKISTTAEGHVASATSVEKSDITALGIPSQDNTYTKSETKALLNNHFVEGDNIEITDNQDGTQTISATGSAASVKAYFGYIGDRRNTFYADAEHTIEIPLEDNTLYIDMTDPTVSGFVLYGRNVDGAIGNRSLIAIGRPYSEGDSWGVVPGDKGYEAYYHATDSSRVTTAQPSGFYKIATTSEGHIASLTNVTKTDITNLGIPAQDTTYESKSAVSGGTAVSLVTTGEKYTWNHKANSSDIPSASSASPKMDGTASSGSSSYWSRADHVHPTDTSRQAALSTTQLSAVNSGVTSTTVSHANATYSAVIPSANSTVSSGDLSSITTNECRVYHNPSNLPSGTTGSVICTTRIFDGNTGYQDIMFITAQGSMYPAYRRAKTGGFWRNWVQITNT